MHPRPSAETSRRDGPRMRFFTCDLLEMIAPAVRVRSARCQSFGATKASHREAPQVNVTVERFTEHRHDVLHVRQIEMRLKVSRTEPFGPRGYPAAARFMDCVARRNEFS